MVEKIGRRGYVVDYKYIYKDLFYLLSIFLADERISKEIKGPDDPLLKILSTEEDITSILIRSAAIARIIINQKKIKINEKNSVVGNLEQHGKIGVLSLREACNKIIHADNVLFEVVEIKKGLFAREPGIMLVGKKNGEKWEAEIDILEFIRKYIKYIK